MLSAKSTPSKQFLFVVAGSALGIFFLILTVESLMDSAHAEQSIWQKTLLIFSLTGISIFCINVLLQRCAAKSIATLSRVVAQLVHGKKSVQFPNFTDSTLQELSTNIQKLNKAKIKSAEKAEQVQRASQQKDAFISSMSHELRTPLNAIIGYSEMLHDEIVESGNAEWQEDIRKIHVAGEHLLSMVNNILDLSKIEAGKMTVFSETFDINNLLNDVRDISSTLTSKNANTLVIDTPKEAGTMTTDLTKVRQSILNFVSNAAKFTEKGTITVRCHIEEEKGQEWVSFDVIDTGIGMTPEQVRRIFQPFQQAEDSTSKKFGGTGLGLTVTKKFSEILGGGVAVHSEVGKGSTFSIRLPREFVSREKE